jgi:hypothetical protein
VPHELLDDLRHRVELFHQAPDIDENRKAPLQFVVHLDGPRTATGPVFMAVPVTRS